ncbi:MAG TPA: YbaK/EbsC family protein [Deinococcales bacterium]|nr:YbaK/EbsC family protein [Deinococcales bacterium]
MPVSTVRDYLKQFGKDEDILEFSASTSTVELAAAEVGTEPARIAKTLAFYDPQDPGRAVLVVAAGDARMHSGSFKRAFSGKARMVAAADVEPLTGHPPGGVCPFANPEGTRVFLDESLRRFDTVWPAAGSASSAVALTIEELEQCSRAEGWVDITRGWREQAD